MFEHKRIFERELRFTKAYQNAAGKDLSEREYLCLKEQIPYMFVPFHKEDLIAGRIDRPMIGFFPIFEGDDTDKTGYVIDEHLCKETLKTMSADPAYTAYDRKEARNMIDFWKKENTKTKIINAFPPEWESSIGTDDITNISAALYPIHRVTGFNNDYGKLLKYGINGLIELIDKKTENVSDAKTAALYDCMKKTLLLIKQVAFMYAAEAERKMKETTDDKRKQELEKMREALLNITERAPQTYREALQLQNLYMLAGRTFEIGRLDDYISGFYCDDLKNGRLSYEEAVKLTDNFFTITAKERGRDGRVIVGGLGRKNETAANEYALMTLDVLEGRKFELYPQISVRFYKGMDERIYNRALELLGRGYTFPVLYNDDINVPSVMRAMDVDRKTAEQYSFLGCGEFQIAYKSTGTPNTVFNTAKMLEITLNNGVDKITGKKCGIATGEIDNAVTFEELMSRFKRQLEHFADVCGNFHELLFDVCRNEFSFLMMSILADDCIERGKAMLDGGIVHLGGTVETYGNTTAYDGMAAIKHVVFEKKHFKMSHLLKALAADFKGYEREQTLLLDAPKFGNDDDNADAIAAELHQALCQSIRNQKLRTKLDSLLVVIINNSMNVATGKHVLATPDGRNAHAYLSNGNNPSAGCDKEGITALINSYTKMDTSIHACGSQNLKLSPIMFKNDMREAKSILGAFFKKGGQQVNLSVLNQADLEDALINPEKHENLIVRVGGYSARFINLPKDVQRDILTRTAY